MHRIRLGQGGGQFPSQPPIHDRLRSVASGRPSSRRAKPALIALFLLWTLVLYDPHWYLAAHGLTVALRAQVILYLVLAGLLLVNLFQDRASRQRWQWQLPILSFALVGALTTPFAVNNGVAREWIQEVLLFWLLIVATVALVDSPRRAERIFAMYGFSFIWWGAWGSRSGLVGWHHVLSNYDGFGAYMVIGLGLCAFLLVGSPPGWFRRSMVAALALCVVGIVGSFARGAFLAGIAVFGAVLARSPKRGKTLMAGVLGGLLVIAAAEVLYPGKFWTEMQSVFQEGTDEGTGEDRWELWMAATIVFAERPVLGVGPRNFGPYASTHFETGEIGGRYENNPGGLYNRSLHNLYFQTLSELGIVGAFVLVLMLVDFWRRNAVLRSLAGEQRWLEMGGRLRLPLLARGLEVAMIGYLVIAAVYSTAGKHWFYTIVAVNLTLHSLVVGTRVTDRERLRGRRIMPVP